MVESYLPGREMTVGIVGTGNKAQVVGVLEIVYRNRSTKQIYSFHAKEYCEQLIDYRLISDKCAEKAKKMALQIWQRLGCRDAGRVDFRTNLEGDPYFLEINPLAGLHPTHSDLPIMWQQAGRRYEDLIGEILASASERTVSLKNNVPNEALVFSSFDMYQIG